MNEIEKLYENCGIKNYRIENWSGFVPDGWKIITDEKDANKVKEIVRDFTAEKQLELIKWLARKDYGNYAESLLISIRDGYNYLSVGITTDFGSEYFYEEKIFNSKQFDETLAGLINNLWQSLTEEERKQIADILKG